MLPREPFLFVLFLKFLAVDEEINGNVEVVGEAAEHPNVGGTLAVFVMRERLAAYAKVHSNLDLTVFSLFSYHFQANKPCILLHF